MGETTHERDERMTEKELDRLLAEDGYGVKLLRDDDSDFQVWELWELMDSRDGWIVGYFDSPEDVCDYVGIWA
jgi:hypothetical protein